MAQNLFGIGFDDATTQFYEMIGSPSSVDETGRATKATGLFAEQEILQGQLEDIQKEMAYSSDSQVAELESKRQGLINEFTDKVATMVNKYMQLYTNGGLPDWMRRKVITLLNIGTTINSFESGSYQAEAANQAGLNDYSAGLQRYVATGLPSGPTIESFARDESGDMEGSIELRAALNRYYGSPRQATADFNTAVERAGLSDIRSEFREQINAIYDAADENNTAPDYDAIEKLQLQYLQAVDAVLVPILNEYGIAVLNNNDFLDEVRRYVNGMVPSDDWRQSVENNRYYLSSRQFPMAEADVQEWLIDRYSSSMRERSIESDQEVVDRLSDIRSDIDAGRMGAAESKIRSLLEGMQVADFYISPEDLNTLYEYQSMLN